MKPANQSTSRGRERVLVCGVLFDGEPLESAGPLTEVRGLCQAAGTEVVGEPLWQKRSAPDSATLLGKGKVEELQGQIRELSPDAVVVDNDLAPAQARNLEKAWGVRVVDRSELILDIFTRRAQTRQARLQVELAQAEYMLPRLRRMWTHLERFEGGIGMRGPGETQLETDKRLVRKRITDLKHELAEIERRTQRQVQSRREQFTVGLVGYTNAGKSTLLNRLTGADAFAADMLFATLDTRTRQWRLPDGRSVLVSDTVGFLQRLPHHLVASFQATLEEALEVDLLIHVVDASHPDALHQMNAVEQVLSSLRHARVPDLIVFNKIDQLADPLRLELLAEGRAMPSLRVSARSGAGLDALAQHVAERLDGRSVRVSVELPYSAGKLLMALKHAGVVESEHYPEEGRCQLVLRLPESALGLFQSREGQGASFTLLEAAREPLLGS